MGRIFFILLTALLLQKGGLAAQGITPKNKACILEVLQAQQDAWNSGDLKGFMKGYWPSDSLMFIGKSGVTRGWVSTLANYERGYPDLDAMGKLTFTLLSVQGAGRKAAFAVGKWHLDRKDDDLQGHFTLLWRKLDGEWVIVADHSS